ncbi:SDR family NAD(P)-dependent oxidoreductase [Aquincola tertiaricarbonis]|uniref:SDR family NAD(P)-dependent oxidoreductase n=1 Tax=Aquincola tertiaricarbonis TaxID=391953 RepID=UPI000614B7A1|nr:SDR family NAD(P)-dependent oxidoreductase [Aquincola tertiaricarbonis]
MQSPSSASHLFIVTGSSRGMGAAMAQQLLQAGHTVLGIARAANPQLTGAEQWQADLAQPLDVAARLEAWLAAMPADRFASASLINNAALLSTPGPLEGDAPEALSAALRVGLEAPLLLSAAFLRSTRGWTGQRKLLHISSGLGRRPMAGSASYCAVKAGLDHFSRALALDEALLPNGARTVSLAPGVIDTDMQRQLRGGDPARFPEQARFANLAATGALDSPEAAAAKVLAFLARPDFGSAPVADVRE